MKKASILINPGAGQGKGRELADLLSERLDSFFEEVEQLELNETTTPVELARKAAKAGSDALFVLGGDGTLNAAVTALAPLAKRPVIGLVPAGTNNTFARLLGFPGEADKAIAAFDFNCVAPLDIGRVRSLKEEGDERYFAYYLALGKLLDATMNTKSQEKDILGSLAYVKNILAGLPRDQSRPMRITVDESIWEGEASHLFVINSTTYGELDFSKRRKELNTGRAHVFILKNDSLLAKMSTAGDIISGKVEENEHIITLYGNKIRLELLNDDVLETDLDGQVGPKLPLVVDILKEHQGFFVTENTPLL